MLTEAETKIHRLKSDCVPVMVILMILGHKWLENETWYLTQKIQDSLETKKKKQMNFATKCCPYWKISLTNLKTLAKFFPSINREL